MAATKPTLVIMVKEPRPGRVKTRLAAEIGAVAACHWTRQRLDHMARTLRAPLWHTRLAIAPDSALTSALFPNLPRYPQGPGTLGERMARLLRDSPKGPTLLIGTDIPAITPRLIARAFCTLARHKSVIGPATDGGFWAVGMDTRRPIPRDLFHNTRWSTEHALTDTLATLPAPAYLPTLRDVDTVADLARLSD